MPNIIPQAGDFAVVSAGGTPGRLIALAEHLNGAGVYSVYEHAFVYVDHPLGDIIQAEPTGAAYAPLTGHAHTLWSTGKIPLTMDQRTAIVRAAISYIGTPYSWLDYLAIAAHHWHLPAPGLEDYVKSTGHMICSQYVDKCFQDAGVKLFDDKRWNGYVTPADLARLLA